MEIIMDYSEEGKKLREAAIRRESKIYREEMRTGVVSNRKIIATVLLAIGGVILLVALFI
jgi:UPF0716 family protein affecting phage T7 exclusion